MEPRCAVVSFFPWCISAPLNRRRKYMKIFRVLGEDGEIVFQERVPDYTPTLTMTWAAPIYAKITKLEVIEIKKEEPNEVQM